MIFFTFGIAGGVRDDLVVLQPPSFSGVSLSPDLQTSRLPERGPRHFPAETRRLAGSGKRLLLRRVRHDRRLGDDAGRVRLPAMVHSKVFKRRVVVFREQAWTQNLLNVVGSWLTLTIISIETVICANTLAYFSIT